MAYEIVRLTQRNWKTELENIPLKKQTSKKKHKRNNSSVLALLTGGEIINITATTENSQIGWHFNRKKKHTSLHGPPKQKPLEFLTNRSVSF